MMIVANETQMPIDKKCFSLIDQQRKNNAVNYLKSIPADGEWEVEFRPKKEKRRPQQNAALWAVAYPPIMKAMGLRGSAEMEELHEFFCGEYFGWVKQVVFNKVKMRPKRTTTRGEDRKKDLVDVLVMADFYSFIQQKAGENGIYVPDPDPMYGLKR